jgi:O-antigen/teichoic acid export membrane protein
MVYLFGVYALVVIAVSVVALGVWVVSYASLVGGVFLTWLLRVATANLSRRKYSFRNLFRPSIPVCRDQSETSPCDGGLCMTPGLAQREVVPLE